MLIRGVATMASTVLACGVAGAQESAWYLDVGGQVAVVDDAGDTYEFANAVGHVGYDFNRNFGIEAEAIVGLDSNSDYYGYELNVDYGIGVFAKIKAPVSRTVEFYGRVGHVATQFTEVYDPYLFGDDEEYETTQNALAFGGGMNVLFGASNGMRFDYTRYDYDFDGYSVDADAVYVGFYHRF